MISVYNGNVEMCKLLIANGALPSINIPDKVISDIIKSYVYIWYVLSVLYTLERIYTSYDQCSKWKYGNMQITNW
jgi:hypothetical protein